MYSKFYLILGCLLHTGSVLSQWSCLLDQDCGDVSGSVCSSGTCICPAGLELALGGTACVNLAPYHSSVCVEDHQCSRLFAFFQCKKENDIGSEGTCSCQAGFHYFHGRCWRTSAYGAACTRDEECLDIPRDPYSLTCDGVCKCAEGYYERQRGECRRIGYAVGDGCVVSEDCQFANGVCDINTLRCIDSTAIPQPEPEEPAAATLTAVNVTSVRVSSVRSHGAACSANTPCPAGFECSVYGACLCPVGYYASDDGTVCYAELGSQSTPEQCVGLLAVVIEGTCTCPPNFFFEDNMRDCVKVTRRISDSCVSDSNCHTFGAASYCGQEREPWQLRSCECDVTRTVWDPVREMCRLFAGVGEACTVDGDCLAGELAIQCVSGVCVCPAGLVAAEGLCLSTGLAINEPCQASLECTGTANTVCAGGVCSCDDGYQENEGVCAPIIGGSCTEDSECVIPDTQCDDTTSTCRCRPGLVPYDDVCWTVATGYKEQCNVTMQCTEVLGENSACRDGECSCNDGYHHRDGRCWTQIGLFEACTRSSECYLETRSEVVVCRNSVCQCDFEHPYSEVLTTCELRSSAATVIGSATVVTVALTYLLLN